MTSSLFPAFARAFAEADALDRDNGVGDSPGTRYHRHLITMIVDRIATAACRGWAPADLRHLSGAGIDHLLFLAHHRIPATVAAPVRRAWQEQCRPAPRPDYRSAQLEKILDQVDLLPELADAAILTDLDHLEGHPGAAVEADPEQQRILTRISALLRKAESTTFEAEAESLVAKAQQLRQRHRLDTVDTADAADTADGGGSFDDHPLVALRVHLVAPWVRHQFLLLHRVAGANSCSTILMGGQEIASVIGHPQDVRHTVELFHSLNRQRDYFMRTSPGAAEAARAGDTTAYRRAFLLSYAARIGNLLEEANTGLSDTRPGDDRALVLLDDRRAEVDDYLHSAFHRTRSMSFAARHSGGWRDGYAAADSSRLTHDPAVGWDATDQL